MSAPSRNVVHRIAPLCTVLVLLVSSSAWAVGFATSLWIANRGNANVLQFPLSASGNVAPTTTLSCLSPGCSGGGFSRVQSVQLDAGGNIWVLDLNNNAVYKFNAGSSGAATPSVTVSGANTHLNAPFSMCFDSSGDLWVANFSNSGANAVVEFSAANLVAGGNIAPTQNDSITGGASGCTFYSSGNLYIGGGNPAVLNEYNAGALTTLNWSITGAATTLATQQVVPETDAAGNIYTDGNSTYLKFNAGACTHAASPCNIAPNATFGAATGFSIAIDASGNIYTDFGTATMDVYNSALVHDHSISGAATTLSQAQYASLLSQAPAGTPTPTGCVRSHPNQNQGIGPRCR